ncbi:hypothetical protein DAPPUDRAFT_116700 [Daphnia pulex]|uniref:Uncharacterized protein n=1 Tax=Daphnia pulex TaxID=6669 RepID=E9HQ77_DAPPU|nr:hypothetical protein DAPPUDRAFT_116700 [Daphnia pulex]|eukprot:EFX66107.1 hypothetical protein DAPPUDRAFT_116700 [Daphnia pulex]
MARRRPNSNFSRLGGYSMTLSSVSGCVLPVDVYGQHRKMDRISFQPLHCNNRQAATGRREGAREKRIAQKIVPLMIYSPRNNGEKRVKRDRSYDNFSDADSKIDVGGVDDTDDNNSVHYMMMEEEDGCCEANGSGVDSDGERDDHLHGHHGHHHGHHHHHNNNNNNNNGSKGKGCSSSSSATDAGGGQHQQLHNSSSGSGHSAGSNSKRKKKTRTVFSRQSGV